MIPNHGAFPMKGRKVQDMNEIKRKVLDYINKNQDECVELLCSLIRIPSENKPPKGDEKACQEFVRRKFIELGLEVDVFTPDSIPEIETHPGYFKGRDYVNRPNVIGYYRGRNAAKRMMVSAHADVVPVGDLNLWTVDPWSGVVKDGKVYGRGASDNKDGIAAMYMALKSIMDCGIQLDNDIIIASVVDEENGGANGSLAAVLKYPCNYYINADGVDINIAPVSVSGGRFRIDFRTWSDSSVCAKDCSDAMFIFYNELKQYEKLKTKEFDENSLFKDVSFKNSALRILEMKTGDELDYASNNHGVLKCYVYSTENKEINEKQLLEIIDRAYEKMDKSKIRKPELSFYRRFFNGAKTKVDDILVRTVANNFEAVTGEQARIKAGPISDLSIYYEFGGGSCLGIGTGSLLGNRGASHMPDEFTTIKKFLTLIKTLALTLIDMGLEYDI
jgi:acetylornithine deacetylase